MQKKPVFVSQVTVLLESTDDNKGCGTTTPNLLSQFKVDSFPCCRQFWRIKLLYWVFVLSSASQCKFSEASCRISKKFYYLPVYFLLFSITRACSFEQKPLPVESKIVTYVSKGVDVSSILVFTFSCVLRVQRVQPYQVQHPNQWLILIVLHQCYWSWWSCWSRWCWRSRW